jgi:hypothetical protein
MSGGGVTDSSTVWQHTRISYAVTAGILGVHLAAAYLIAGRIGRVDGAIWLLATTAVPVSQATLLAVWAALSRTASFVRIPVAVIGLVGVWYVELQSLAWTSQDWRSAAHAGMFAVQAAIVFVVAASVAGLVRRSRRRKGGLSATKRFQFTLGSLLAWAGAIAVLLGLGKTALAASGWTLDVTDGQVFWHGLVIGAYNACYGLLIAWALLLGRGRRPWRLAIAWVAVGLLAWSEEAVLIAVFGSNGRVGVMHWIMWSAFQVLYLSATLIPLSLTLRVTWAQPLCRSPVHE